MSNTAIGVDISSVAAMLKGMDGEIKEKAMLAALKAGAEVEQLEIQANCPERIDLPSGTALPIGALRSDVVIKMSGKKINRPYAVVKFGKYSAHVARWVEEGHKVHHGGRGKHGTDTGGSTQPNPFVSRSFEASLGAVQEAIQTTFIAQITKADKASNRSSESE
jgi:hypothetical protein